MNDRPARHLFEAFGVELEYMIVDAETLSVRPITDQLLEAVAGELVSDVECGEITWSNELALHVVELKTTDPAPRLAGLSNLFQEQVVAINAALRPFHARLMPTAMHPWMNPDREMKLWPHDNSPVYAAFDRIFDCRGHGWANLQSVHLNLPFADDAEFGRLHAAIRLVLPILPALAASSPICEERLTGIFDTRLDVYRNNARRVPSVSGHVVPEPVYTQADYEREILGMIYRDIAPLDPDAVLQHEWLNARGAIARFERNTIEIRVLDVQECPQADLAICEIVTAVLRGLVSERWQPFPQQQSVATESLESVLLATIRDADRAVISDAEYLRQFGWRSGGSCTAGELWKHLVEHWGSDTAVSDSSRQALDVILREGPLSRRIANRLQANPSRESIAAVYQELCDSLATGRMFASAS